MVLEPLREKVRVDKWANKTSDFKLLAFHSL